MALIWKLLQVAESTFRKLKGTELLSAVSAGQWYEVQELLRALTSALRAYAQHER